MYEKSQNFAFLHQVFPRNTLQSNTFEFQTDSFEGTLYKGRPYFVGTKLWNALPKDVIDLPDIFSFKSSINPLLRRDFYSRRWVITLSPQRRV